MNTAEGPFYHLEPSYPIENYGDNDADAFHDRAEKTEKWQFSSVQPKTVRQSIGRDYRCSVYVKYVNLKEKLLQNQRMCMNDGIYEV